MQVSSRVEFNGGSEVDRFHIDFYKIQGTERSKTEIQIPVNHRSDLEYTVEGLEPDSTYEFQIAAENCVGRSGLSEISEPVNLGICLYFPVIP